MRAAIGLVNGLFVFVLGVVSALWFGMRYAWPHRRLPDGERELRANEAARRWSAFIVDDLLAVRVAHLTPLPDLPGRGVLIVANHRSWLDPMLIMACTGSNGLSKGSIGRIPFVGYFGRLTGAVFFDRMNPDDRARARAEVRRLLRAGCRLLVFPEGTRTRDGRIGKRPSMRLIEDAWADGLPVLPCAVRDTERVISLAPPGAHRREACAVWWGTVCDPATFASAEAFSAAVWAQVLTHAENGRD
jgi:1-acyl-sn-glycerol-3-phosphate acyltransferase